VLEWWLRTCRSLRVSYALGAMILSHGLVETFGLRTRSAVDGPTKDSQCGVKPIIPCGRIILYDQDLCFCRANM
jgi:hypothetical protein